MTRYPLSLKHKILTEYRPRSRTHNFSALATTYGIRGGHMTISKWHHKWDGTPSSLEYRRGGGRKVKLNSKQVQQYITKPIRKANQDHVAIHYPQLLDTIKEKTHVDVSLRTIQRYGEKKEGIKGKRTSKKTEKECKNIYYIYLIYFSICIDSHHIHNSSSFFSLYF